MGEALRIPSKPIEEGSDGEPLTCDCGHDFTRGQIDLRIEVYDTDKFPWFNFHEMDGEDVMEALRRCVRERHECPECSCCCEEDGSVVLADPEDEEEWMCTTCLTKHDSEKGALDCCS